MYRTVILRSLALAVPVLAAACAPSLETADPDPPNQPYGELVNIGNGTARTYVTWTDEDDGTKSPNAIGIELTADAFEGLPKQLTDGGWCHVAEDGAIRCLPGHEFVLSLPEAAAVPPYQWVLLNWNPQGHIPPRVYNHPHFDFHFYTMGQEKREEIRPGVEVRDAWLVSNRVLHPVPRRERQLHSISREFGPLRRLMFGGRVGPIQISLPISEARLAAALPSGIELAS